MPTKRIEYIEDGEWRNVLGPAFRNGFAREGVVVGVRQDFTELKAELESGDLANVYILDNEIAGEEKEGAQMALEIHKRAIELGKEVLIITILCSAADKVRELYGDKLEAKGIPICFKLTDAAIVGFYIGRCLEEGKTVDFQQWLTSEGITMPKNTNEAREVQNMVTTQIEIAESGGFYLKPGEFVRANREGMIKYTPPESIRELDRQFPISDGIEIKG